MCKCINCEFAETCPLVEQVNFCKDCIYFDDCDILETCEGGEYVECNNGFESKYEEEAE